MSEYWLPQSPPWRFSPCPPFFQQGRETLLPFTHTLQPCTGRVFWALLSWDYACFCCLRYSLSTCPRLALNSYGPPALALLVLGFQVWAITPDRLWLIDTPLQSTRLWASWGKFCLVFLFCFVFAVPHRGIGTEEFQQGHWHSNWPSTPYSMADFKAG